MGIHPLHLRGHVIRPTLEILGLPSADRAEDLLFRIAGAESEFGHYLRQHPSGPAMGIFQMEVATYFDIWSNYLNYKPEMRDLVLDLVGAVDPHRMVWDMRHATIMARLHLYRRPEALPAVGDIASQALWWKKFYNTSKGHGTVTGFIHKNTNVA